MEGNYWGSKGLEILTAWSKRQPLLTKLVIITWEHISTVRYQVTQHTKPNRLEQTRKHYGKADASNAAPCGHDPHCKSTAAVEVMTHDWQGRIVPKANWDAEKNALKSNEFRVNENQQSHYLRKKLLPDLIRACEWECDEWSHVSENPDRVEILKGKSQCFRVNWTTSLLATLKPFASNIGPIIMPITYRRVIWREPINAIEVAE